MRRVHSHVIHRAAAALIGAVVLTACAGNVDSGALGGGTTVQAPVAPSGQAAIQNDDGEYSGTATDSIFGNGSVSASLAQDRHVVGGLLTATFGSTALANSVAAQTSTGAALAGVEVANINGSPCSFSLSATYNSHTHKLDGTYQAVHGCTGESGSFSLTKECYYPRGGLLDADPSWNGGTAKPSHGVSPC